MVGKPREKSQQRIFIVDSKRMVLFFKAVISL
jgi:hypothetical protein